MESRILEQDEYREALTKMLKALADPVRFNLLRLLRDRDSMNVSQMVETTGLEQTRVSHHLACLRNCGIVSTKRDGKYVFYELASKWSAGRIITLIEEHVLQNMEEILNCERV